MKDCLKFVCRAAAGAAIVPVLLWVYYLCGFPATPLFWYFLSVSVGLVIHGATIGAIIWATALFTHHAGALLRLAVGVLLNSAVLTLGLLAAGDSWESRSAYLDPESQILPFLILLGGCYLLSGAFAGLACPPGSIYQPEPKQLSWKQVRRYALAEAERDFWQMQLEAAEAERGSTCKANAAG
ncbi:MAG: hypothetical protein QOD33_5 [Pyrinomonadaceae bacterium]|jgi:hypothetical protein|nr:hypothetical protein [Pyrinomonadaceae bacterium]